MRAGLAALAALVAGVAAQDDTYLSAKLAPPWVDTTESPTLDLKPPPQPENPPPPPKDGAIWGTFYPAAPPPPPPPPPPMPFPLSAAAGGDRASGTASTGDTAPASSFLQLLERELSAQGSKRAAASPSQLAEAHALALSAAARGSGLAGGEVSRAASSAARRAARAFLPAAARPARATVASLLQMGASPERAAARRTADALLDGAAALPRFASTSASAYASRRAAAAAALRSAARAAQESALSAMRAARGMPLGVSAVRAGIAPMGRAADRARLAGLEATRALRAAAARARFRETSARAAAAGGAEGASGGAAKVGPHFGLNYYGNPYSFPYNPWTFATAAHFGPTGLGAHPMGGPLYANYGYYPSSGDILKGVVTPTGETDTSKLGKTGKPSASDATHDDNGNAEKDGGKPSGAYNPSAPPFFMSGTGWPYPYFMNPNMAPPAHLNPISPAHYAPRHTDLPVYRYW